MKSESLDKLAMDVAEDQAAIVGQNEDTRMRVLRIGKRLLRMQKLQKMEQRETGQTWREFLEDTERLPGSFPGPTSAVRYMLIARFPGAYAVGMSIKEGYRSAGQWKRHGGAPPPTVKKRVTNRPLVRIQIAVGRAGKAIDLLTSNDVAILAGKQTWDGEEIDGALDEISRLRRSCDAALKALRTLTEVVK